MTIDSYLAELRRLLPRLARLRALPEVREHLRDAAARLRAAGVPPADAEDAATGEFGEVEVVARRLREELAVRETRLASSLALASAAVFVLPLYVIPENTLPPAPWAEKPRDLAALQLATVALWASACVLAAAGVALAWTDRRRFAAPVLLASSAAVAASTAVSAVLVTRWFAAAPATSAWPLLGAPIAATCVAAVGVVAIWARRRSVLLV